MTIKQLNATYLVNEDRILFRFNTQDQAEYRLWFTRRVTLFILAATSHLLTKKLEQAHSVDAAKALTEFEKQAILEVANQQNEAPNIFQSGTQFPIGADPLLVMDVTCALTKNGKKLADISALEDGQIDDAISIDFVLPAGANLNLKLSGNLLQAMCILLDQLRENAGWGDAILKANASEVKELDQASKANEKFSIH